MDVVDGPRGDIPVYTARRGVPWLRWLVRVTWALVVVLALAAAEIGLLALLRANDPWAGATRAPGRAAAPLLSDDFDVDLVAGLVEEIGATGIRVERAPSWLLGRPTRLEARFRSGGERLEATVALDADHPAVARRIGDGRARLERIDGRDVLVDRFATLDRLLDVAVVTCQGVAFRIDDPVDDAAAAPAAPTVAARAAVDLISGACPGTGPLPADAGLLRVVLAAGTAGPDRDALAREVAGTDGVIAAHPVRWEDAARMAARREAPGKDVERLQDSLLVRVAPGARDAFLTSPVAADAAIATIEDEGPAPALVEVLPRPDADLALLETELRADPEVAVVTLRPEERARSRFAGTPTPGNPDARTALLVWLRAGGDPARTAFAERIRARPDVEGTS
jgi:hypothetical protein